MKKVTALALILAAQAGLCHAATEELPPLPTKTWHVSVKAPGKAKEDRVVDDRYLITYSSRLVEFEGKLPDASVKPCLPTAAASRCSPDQRSAQATTNRSG